jgi:hypothetical protein
VFHLGGGTLDKSSPRKTYLNFRNGLSIIFKNEKATSLIWKLPLRIMLDWLAVFQFSILSGLKHGLAIMHAHLDFILSIKDQLRKRKKVICNNSNNPRYQGFIIWDYFILKKKIYRK